MSSNSDSESEGICEVERIVGKRIGYGEIQYRIKWKGYSTSNNTWEPISNLQCPQNIAEYEATHVNADDSLKWIPKPTKIISGQLIDDKMEYFVHFADGREEMVALLFGPMKKLIKVYETEQAKRNVTDDKMAKDEMKQKSVKRQVMSDQNENREENTANSIDDDGDDAANCLFNHAACISNMRRFDDQIQFHVECKMCHRKYWQPAKVLKQNHPQKVIDFYESCIEWKRD